MWNTVLTCNFTEEHSHILTIRILCPSNSVRSNIISGGCIEQPLVSSISSIGIRIPIQSSCTISITKKTVSIACDWKACRPASCSLEITIIFIKISLKKACKINCFHSIVWVGTLTAYAICYIQMKFVALSFVILWYPCKGWCNIANEDLDLVDTVRRNLARIIHGDICAGSRDIYGAFGCIVFCFVKNDVFVEILNCVKIP